MKKQLSILMVLLALASWTTGAMAKTVTVQSQVATGGDNYQTLIPAIFDFPNWSDGDNDTIEVWADGVHPVSCSGSAAIWIEAYDALAEQPRLTIKAKAGDQPILLATGDYGLWFESFKVTFQGLTFISDADHAANLHAFVTADYRCQGLTFEDCVFTANDGSGGPLLDWSAARPDPAPSARSAIILGEGYGVDTQIAVTIRNSVMAFTYSTNGCIDIQFGLPGTSSLTLENTLIAKCARGISIGVAQPATFAMNVKDSAILDCDNRGIIAGNYAGTITLEDSILAGCGSSLLELGSFTGTLNVARSTFYYNNNNDRILITGCAENTANFAFSDCIFSQGGDSVIRFQPESVVKPFNTLTFNYCAAFMSAIYRSDQAQTVKDAVNAITWVAEDPQFVRTALSASDTMRDWDVLSNNLFDVGNIAYKGKGTQGGAAMALLGGANGVEGVPVELGSFSVE